MGKNHKSGSRQSAFFFNVASGGSQTQGINLLSHFGRMSIGTSHKKRKNRALEAGFLPLDDTSPTLYPKIPYKEQVQFDAPIRTPFLFNFPPRGNRDE